jgi:hypothetical protein
MIRVLGGLDDPASAAEYQRNGFQGGVGWSVLSTAPVRKAGRAGFLGRLREVFWIARIWPFEEPLPS